MSIALRVLPSKLELKRRDGSGILAPRANVSFTTFVYASPVETIPWCDQTGVPGEVGFTHFHSSVISGSASRISARMRARVSPRHPPRSRMRWSMSRPGASSFGDVFFLMDIDDGLVNALWGRSSVQSARRPLRHLVAYGSTNKYRPVSRSKASGNSGE